MLPDLQVEGQGERLLARHRDHDYGHINSSRQLRQITPLHVSPVNWLERHQLCGSAPGLRASQAPGVFDGAWRLVLLQVGAVDRVLQALAPGAHGAYGDFAIGNLDSAVRLLEKRPIPASRFQAPRTHEDPALDHHRPDADETVRLRARADAQDMAGADGVHDVLRETSLPFHARTLVRASIDALLPISSIIKVNPCNSEARCPYWVSEPSVSARQFYAARMFGLILRR